MQCGPLWGHVDSQAVMCRRLARDVHLRDIYVCLNSG